MDSVTTPGRYRKALVHVVDDALGADFGREFGQWALRNLRSFVRGGDPNGVERFNYELTTLGDHFDGLAPFHAALMANLEDALGPCGVDDFDPRYHEVNATLYHHGSRFRWHDDFPDYDGSFAPTRRITFAYYMHTPEKMFSGGELGFLDGTLVEPKNDRLVFFHPLQQHEVRKVECWSAEASHGRWALMGWVHGDPPEGYAETAAKLRGTP